MLSPSRFCASPGKPAWSPPLPLLTVKVGATLLSGLNDEWWTTPCHMPPPTLLPTHNMACQWWWLGSEGGVRAAKRSSTPHIPFQLTKIHPATIAHSIHHHCHVTLPSHHCTPKQQQQQHGDAMPPAWCMASHLTKWRNSYSSFRNFAAVSKCLQHHLILVMF